MHRMSSFTCSVKLCLKVGTALLDGPVENGPISSPVRLLIQKLFRVSDSKGSKIASCVAPQTRYLQVVQIQRVIRWPLFVFNHLQAVLMEALQQHVQCSQSCSAPSDALFNELWKQKLINNGNYWLTATTLPLTLRQWRLCRVKPTLFCCWNKWELVNSKLNSQTS